MNDLIKYGLQFILACLVLYVVYRIAIMIFGGA